MRSTDTGSEMQDVRSWAESLQDDAVELLRLAVQLSPVHPRTWTDAERFQAARVAESLLGIEAGAHKARVALEAAARRKPGPCMDLLETR